MRDDSIETPAEDGHGVGPWVSPVFGDVVAKVTLGIRQEVVRRRRLGLPLIVDRGHGIEELTG